MSPKSDSRSHKNCFLSRLPVLLRFDFDRQLIEISMPYFYEPLSGIMKVEGDYPKRFQKIINEVNVFLVKFLDSPPGGIDYEKVPLHLELNCNATDMGWQIEPQESASFDLKQNIVPLRDIFDSFMANLAKECTSLGVVNPLSNVNLYALFRALKEQGYTYQMIQSVPLGRAGGNLYISLLYGEKNDGLPTIMWIPKAKSTTISRLRYEIWKSQKIMIKNPYTISSLIPN